MADPIKPEPLIKPDAKSQAKPEAKLEPLVKPETKSEPGAKAKKSSPEEKLRKLEEAWEEVDLIAFCTEGGDPHGHPTDENNPIVRMQEQEGGKSPRYCCKKHWAEKVSKAKGEKEATPGVAQKVGRFKIGVIQAERPANWSETHKGRKGFYEGLFRQAFVKKPGDEETKIKPDGTLNTAIRWWEALQDEKEEEFEKIKQNDPSATLKAYPQLDDVINVARKFVKHYDEIQRNEKEALKYETEQMSAMKNTGKYTNPTYAEWMDAYGKYMTKAEIKKAQRDQDKALAKQQKIAKTSKSTVKRPAVVMPAKEKPAPALAGVQSDSKFAGTLDKALLEVANV